MRSYNNQVNELLKSKITKQKTEKFVRRKNVYVFAGYMTLLGIIIGLVYGSTLTT